MVDKTSRFFYNINFIFTFFFAVLLCTPLVFWNGAMLFYGIVILGWLFSAISIVFIAGKIKIFKIQLMIVFWIVYILFYKLFGQSSAIFFNYVSRIVFWFAFFIYCFYYFYFPRIYKNRLCQISIIVLLANIIQNFVVLLFYPNASRGITQGSAYYDFYRDLNIGSTSFVFAALLLFIVFLGLFVNAKKIFIKILFFIILLLLIYFQFQCARVISIILMFLSVAIYYIYNKKLNFKIIIACIVILLSVFIIIYIIPILFYFSEIIKNQYLSIRLRDLAFAIKGEDITGSTISGRISFYLVSIKTFFNNPVFGVGEHWTTNYIAQVGQHSEMFDALARYGIFGGIVWISFYTWYYINIVKNNLNNIYNATIFVGFIIFVIYSFLNNVVSHQAQTVVLFFIIPFLPTIETIFNTKKSEKRIEISI